ncbi:MAG: TM2 domain-containing protein [Bacteroidales bacterium]|nr:TM2 domain-containing protein [Bacteroidales bacterium]MBP5383231.1 TM2 domain-containing protein [Bacteroidales bacterium]MBP5521734.1 TM2 domain-containing protein [Bacteroidales bacterium]
MKKLVLIIAAVFGMAIAANAANYKVDNNAIDALIENAEEVLTIEVAEAAPLAANLPTVSKSEIQPAVALVLNFLLGGFGIHRHYMGTSPAMWAIYTFTFAGIFGIVPTVDLVMLIIGTINNDIGQYINNRKFFMWI